ncbi:MAG: YybS family protein [Desulfobacterales bacterium]|nr:YybS family protein [Desulfobacterales bacterium]
MAKEAAIKDILNGIAYLIGLFVVSSYMPIIGILCLLLVPLPAIFFRIKIGRKNVISILGVAIITTFLIFEGHYLNVFVFSALVSLGFLLGEFYEKEYSIEKTVVYSVGSVALGIFFCFILYSNVVNVKVTKLISDYMGKNFEVTLALYEKMDMPQETIHEIKTSLETIKYKFVRILPGIILAFIIFTSWINILLSRTLLKKNNLLFPNFGQLNRWMAPEQLIWGIIICGGLLLLPNEALDFVCLNGIIILSTIYFFQGIAIVSFYFEKKEFPAPLKALLYCLILLQQILLLVVIGLGIFDIWFDFRKLNSKEPSV